MTDEEYLEMILRLEEELYQGAVGTFLRTAHRRAEQPFASWRASPALLGFCGDALWLCTLLWL